MDFVLVSKHIDSVSLCESGFRVSFVDTQIIYRIGWKKFDASNIFWMR